MKEFFHICAENIPMNLSFFSFLCQEAVIEQMEEILASREKARKMAKTKPPPPPQVQTVEVEGMIHFIFI